MKGVFTNCRDELENPALIKLPEEVKRKKRRRRVQKVMAADSMSDEVSEREGLAARA